jgi:hypothetical protein
MVALQTRRRTRIGSFRAVDEGSDQRRTRIFVAVVLGVGLLIAVLVVVLAGSGGGDTEAAAADQACVDDWNGDETMLAFGLHQFSGHGYERVQVVRLTPDGKPTDSEDGLCAVIFAARALDPEPGARAQVLQDDKWTGIENLGNVDDAEVAKLQSDAFAAVNASLTGEGRLAPSSRG